ncbi:MAG: hypothetical protein IPL65_10300 [Lewinellaceae bacterium]|nr:hypothetical protein [Lewinellaceae bacterium]
MLSFFLNKQQGAKQQESAKRSLDKVVENEHTQLLAKQELNRIEGGSTNQNNRMLSDRISLDDFFSGPVPQ